MKLTHPVLVVADATEGVDMWAFESVFYQIYPLGFCGASYENDGRQTNGITKMLDWIPHMKQLGINAVYFSPVFESDSHGYNTRDFYLIDRRLGSNESFSKLCHVFHENGMKVVLDGVFHHVGRGFWAFRDVLEKREASDYKDWFYLDFHRDSAYQDGLWYEGWEGHYDLVKLNLRHPEVVRHLLGAVSEWIKQFGIDGIRLDVAYSLDLDFMRQLRAHCDQCKAEFFLLGEMIHGDYNRLLREGQLNSVTNYECYKGLYSSFNDLNLFEINHSLNRQFGSQGALYHGEHLFSFVDNHDVSRIASVLKNKEHLKLIYTLLLTMPGIPCIYYGSEWGIEGEKGKGDQALRPEVEQPITNELSSYIERIVRIRSEEKALQYGEYKSLFLTNRQCIFERRFEQARILIGINADQSDVSVHWNPECSEVFDLLLQERKEVGSEVVMRGMSAFIWEVKL